MTLKQAVRVSFNGHPPLGVNATDSCRHGTGHAYGGFQWAPTLGGECYTRVCVPSSKSSTRFNGHPPLGVNATLYLRDRAVAEKVSMGTHPWG